MSGDKDFAQLRADLADEGFTFTPRKNHRFRVIAPDGTQTFWGTRVKDGRTVANARAWAEKHRLPSKEVPVPSTPPVRRGPGSSTPPSAPAQPAPVRPSPAVMPRRPSSAPQAPAPAAAAPEVNEPVRRPAREVTMLGPKLPAGHPAVPRQDARLIPKGGGVWEEPDRPIDPETALAMLEYNFENRTVQQRLVDSWARTMAEGGWVEELGDPIRFADTGKLIDGQKRLLAVVQAGVTIRFNTITGLPESAQDAVDIGQHRTVADQLKINGFKNSMVVAAGARLLWLWDHGALISNNPAPSNVEVQDYVLALTGDQASIEASASVAVGAKGNRGIPASVLAACHYRMTCVDPSAAQEFFEKFVSGANLHAKSPILALRESAMNRKEDRAKTTNAQWVYMVARAWTLWRKGASTSRIILPRGGVRTENIPRIV